MSAAYDIENDCVEGLSRSDDEGGYDDENLSDASAEYGLISERRVTNEEIFSFGTKDSVNDRQRYIRIIPPESRDEDTTTDGKRSYLDPPARKRQQTLVSTACRKSSTTPLSRFYSGLPGGAKRPSVTSARTLSGKETGDHPNARRSS